jgi:hypothetical protein
LDRAATAAAYAAQPDNIVYAAFGNVKFVPNPKKVGAKKRLDGLDASLESATAAYADALAQAIYKQWIETPSYYRCVENPVWEYCLSQAALASYKARIAASVQ